MVRGRQLLVATSNEGKRDEFRRLLPDHLHIVSLDERPVAMPPEEGTSYAEIACRKALAAANATGLTALADDSGLEVDALDRAPGLTSARYGGEPRSDERNRTAVLAAMRGVPLERRGAAFHCSVALAEPGKVIAVREGSCEGTVAVAAIGDAGFGYDPIFLLPDGRSMAQLEPWEKDSLSHRGRALRAMLPVVLRVVESRSDVEERS